MKLLSDIMEMEAEGNPITKKQIDRNKNTITTLLKQGESLKEDFTLDDILATEHMLLSEKQNARHLWRKAIVSTIEMNKRKDF